MVRKNRNPNGKKSSQPTRCGVVLAGGEGERLRSFIYGLRGSHLPKQFVNFIGTRSMLEHTFHRAEKLIPPSRLFTVVGSHHLKHPEVQGQLSKRPRETIVVQPENKGTGPGLLLPLLHIYHRYPHATVAVFPSDHFILEEDLFVTQLYLACRAVEREPSSLILLGIDPSEPEREYGYILPGEKVTLVPSLDIRRVSGFVEKPDGQMATDLMKKGSLWNTMVMVFKAHTLLELVQKITPRLYSIFQKIGEALGTSHEERVLDGSYKEMHPVDFSKGLLQKLPRNEPGSLLTLPVRGVLWSDWGSPPRVLSVLKKTGYLARVRGVPEETLFNMWDSQLSLPASHLVRSQS